MWNLRVHIIIATITCSFLIIHRLFVFSFLFYRLPFIAFWRRTYLRYFHICFFSRACLYWLWNEPNKIHTENVVTTGSTHPNELQTHISVKREQRAKLKLYHSVNCVLSPKPNKNTIFQIASFWKLFTIKINCNRPFGWLRTWKFTSNEFSFWK